MVKSPSTGNYNTKQIKSISTRNIIEAYLNSFGLDVSRFFEGIPEISVFECLDTGYQFYYPFNVDGDGAFYEHLQQYDWYYMPWKWEHQQTALLLKPNMKVLEVGCAKGDFLARIRQDFNVQVTGLELNQRATEEARNSGLNVINEMVQDHAAKHENQYDLVCSFQVLEHIADVKSFIEANIKCVKKGGKLVIGVPNNESFMKYDFDNNILNMPPHHMGLWKEKSLKALQQYFNLSIDSLLCEPIQEYHKDWYKSVTYNHFKQIINRKRYQFFYRLLPNFLKWRVDSYGAILFRYFTKKHGHTILVIYTKK